VKKHERQVVGCALLVIVWLVIGRGAIGWAQQDEKKAPAEGKTTTAPAEGTASTDNKPPSAPGPSTEQNKSPQPTSPSESSSAEPQRQAEPLPTEAKTGETATAPEGATPAEATPAPPAEAPGVVSVDFKDADIRQVLRILSLKGGVDIVAGTGVEGLVTIKLTSVPWEQALDIILRTYGFTYERKGTIVRVMTVADLEKEALSTEVFPLDYAKAKDVPGIIQEMLSERGRVKFDDRTNTIIVTDIPAGLFQIRQVIHRIDQRTPQVLIEAKIIETKLKKTENLGINWSPSYALTASAVSIPSTFPFPMKGSLGGFGRTFIPRAGTFTPSSGVPSSLEGRIPETGGTFTFGTLGAAGLTATLNFLQSRTDTHIVSNPSIAVLNNQEAKIHIGLEYPIPNYTIDATTGRPTISGYTAKNTGTILTVTPHVNPSMEIVVDLRPEVIAVIEPVSYNTGGAGATTITLPQFSTQTAQTQVRIQNGETIAIGGLVKETNAKLEEKVPFLGDLPLIGFLFTNVSQNTAALTSEPKRQDLLIFLTVTLKEEPARHEQAVAAAPSQTAPPEQR